MYVDICSCLPRCNGSHFIYLFKLSLNFQVCYNPGLSLLSSYIVYLVHLSLFYMFYSRTRFFLSVVKMTLSAMTLLTVKVK